MCLPVAEHHTDLIQETFIACFNRSSGGCVHPTCRLLKTMPELFEFRCYFPGFGRQSHQSVGQYLVTFRPLLVGVVDGTIRGEIRKSKEDTLESELRHQT